MSKFVCKICIEQNGLKAADLRNWPNVDDPGIDAWNAEHLERVHHLPVRREGETEEQAQLRFLKAYPEAGGPLCQCPRCVKIRRNKITVTQ